MMPPKEQAKLDRLRQREDAVIRRGAEIADRMDQIAVKKRSKLMMASLIARIKKTIPADSNTSSAE